MARTRQQWEAIYNAPATTLGLSLSVAAEWLGLRDLVISVAIVFESILEVMKGEVNTALDTKQPGSIYWYPGMVKAFQYGDSLTVVDGVPQYAVIDEAALIVSQVSVKEQESGNLLIKVAKTESDELVQLSGPELSDLKDYIKARRAPGVGVNVYSLPADIVKYTLTCRYDPAFNKADLETALQSVFDNFKLSFPFDAIFYKTQLIAQLQAITGVKSIVLQIDMVLDDGDHTITDLDEYQELPAGYFNYDEDSSIALVTAP